MASEMGLIACNVSEDEHLQSQWTFRSCLGACRRLDYILVNDTLCFQNAGPTNLLDMGSDHRAVGTCIDIPRPAPKQQRANKLKQTQVDWNQYQEKLRSQMRNLTRSLNLNFLEKVMVDTAKSAARSRNREQQQESSHLQHLRGLRRNTEDEGRRRQLSKEILKETRRER